MIDWSHWTICEWPKKIRGEDKAKDVLERTRRRARRGDNNTIRGWCRPLTVTLLF